MVSGNEIEIGVFVQELGRLRRRAARQKRSLVSGPEAWQEWAATMDEIAKLTRGLVARPVNDIAGLAAKFNAILWQIEVNESLLDSEDLRQLRRFGRDLAILAGSSS